LLSSSACTLSWYSCSAQAYISNQRQHARRGCTCSLLRRWCHSRLRPTNMAEGRARSTQWHISHQQLEGNLCRPWRGHAAGRPLRRGPPSPAAGCSGWRLRASGLHCPAAAPPAARCRAQPWPAEKTQWVWRGVGMPMGCTPSSWARRTCMAHGHIWRAHLLTDQILAGQHYHLRAPPQHLHTLIFRLVNCCHSIAGKSLTNTYQWQQCTHRCPHLR
jgi:hypothetical protein